ncbi:FIG024746: hypothetical protein [hydrothermal vent metagenome]|uniref:Low-complexity protein n=1 Tax=hydrothermal vent metagenome TaxID=652676 RepID=A0A3B0XE84_9ZZZZ
MMKKITTLSMAAIFAAFLSLSVQAAENPFGMSDLKGSSQTAMSSGKCGGDKKEGKCGEGKCGGDKKKAGEKKEGEKKEGKCGEGKCGEGKCGANK